VLPTDNSGINNLISEEALEKFKRDERKILTNAINKTKELFEIEISKLDEADKWFIHAFRYDTIKKRFSDNYANLLYEI